MESITISVMESITQTLLGNELYSVGLVSVGSGVKASLLPWLLKSDSVFAFFFLPLCDQS
jgi:hypothetical protein